MRLRTDQLESRIKKQFDPVYLISGDEPLQLNEATDLIRRSSAQAGYNDRSVFDVQSGFNWTELAAEADALSLFAEKRLIDLRLKSAAIGNEGSKALFAYCERPPQDTLLLITAPKLDRKQLNNKWIKAIDQLGAVVQIWPIEGNRLLPWLEQRMRNIGLTPEAGVVPMLAERVEGNLLAASQEIDKLLLLNGPGIVSVEALTQSVSDSARFDVFGLVDHALQGNTARCIRILSGLHNEGVAAPVVLWALARELRNLYSIARSMKNGASTDAAMSKAGVWEKRKPIVGHALRNLSLTQLRRLLRICHQSDILVKGIEKGNPWDHFEQIILGLSGKRIPQAMINLS